MLAKLGKRQNFTDCFVGAGLKFLKELKLPKVYREEIAGYIYLIEEVKQQIAFVKKKIRACVKEENEDARLLMIIPGIFWYSTLLLASKIGDINRFSSYRKLCVYAGLVAITDKIQSSDKIHENTSLRIQKDRYARPLSLLGLCPAASTPSSRYPGL